MLIKSLSVSSFIPFLMIGSVHAVSDLKIEAKIPGFTRSISTHNPKLDYWGDAVLAWTWNMTDLEGPIAQNQQWVREPFSWLIYDDSLDPYRLEDKDIVFNLSCEYEFSTSAKPGDTYHLELLTDEPYLRSQESWANMAKGGHVMCPTGECVHDKCRDGKMKLPTWDQQYLANQTPN